MDIENKLRELHKKRDEVQNMVIHYMYERDLIDDMIRMLNELLTRAQHTGTWTEPTTTRTEPTTTRTEPTTTIAQHTGTWTEPTSSRTEPTTTKTETDWNGYTTTQ